MKSLTCLMVLLLAIGIAPSGAADPTVPARPPLPPEGIRVVAPDPALPPEIRDFAGSWYGLWIDPGHPDRGIPEILVVEEVVSKDDLKVILSWGDCPVCHSKADWRRFSGKIANLCIDWKKLPEPFSKVTPDALGNKKVLYFSYPEGRVFTFVLDEQGQLIGTDGVGAVKMSRLK